LWKPLSLMNFLTRSWLGKLIETEVVRRQYNVALCIHSETLPCRPSRQQDATVLKSFGLADLARQGFAH
jgi:hypothetical protein